MKNTIRLNYIDCLRGAAMLMVVYSHVLSFMMGRLQPSPLGQYMHDIMLPFFFFLSGFCAYKDNSPQPSFLLLMKQIWGKTKAILIPTIVMFLVFMMYSKQNPLSIIFNYDKSGYWFTWVLFQIFLIFIPFDGISRRFSNKYLKVAVIVSPFVILSILFYFLGYNYKIANLFEWVKVVGYYFFFMTGIIVKLFRNDIHNAFNNKYLLSILLIVALLTYNFIDNLGGKTLVINILLIYVCFYKLETRFTQPNNIVSKILRTIGKNTLEIYLIHFFLLFNIPFMPEYLSSLQNDKCFGTNSCSSLPEFLIVGSILYCYAIYV